MRQYLQTKRDDKTETPPVADKKNAPGVTEKANEDTSEDEEAFHRLNNEKHGKSPRNKGHYIKQLGDLPGD